MAISARSPINTAATLVLLIISLISFTPTNSISDPNNPDPVTSELLSRRSQSPSGVIHLTDDLLRRILTSTSTSPRTFSLLIFFDAQHLHSKPDLQLPALKSEFSLLATSFIANNENNPSDSSKLFFCDVEFKESQSLFAMFGVNSLPHIRLLPAAAKDLKSDTQQMDAGDFSRLAESMAEFIESKTKLTVGPIRHPPIISKKQVTLIAALILISSPLIIKKIIEGKTPLHDPKLWLAGSIFVYFFSVSGSMHNIIRKMPLVLGDQNDPSRMIFFYQGSGMQLGAEGFIIGFLYTIVGLLLAFVTHVLIKVKNENSQKIMMIFALSISFWAVKKVVYLDNWKTGYGIHAYWPSSWK